MGAYIYLAWGRERAPEERDLPDAIRTDEHRFELKRALRQGGNSVVFEAHHYQDRRFAGVCAVKFLKRLDDQRRDRFANEVEVQSSLDHDRIAKLYAHGGLTLPPRGAQVIRHEDVVVPWAAIALGGTNLRDHVKSQPPLAGEELCQAIADIGAAIGHIHDRGFIHRDIKPANFVWDRSAGGRVVMIDFGIAKRIGDDVSARPLDFFTKQMEFVGPVFFSSPELIAYAEDKEHPVGPRSDLFQFGKVVWYLATGTVTAGVPARRDDPTGGRLRTAMLDLLSDDPSDRPESAGAATAALLEAVRESG